jgi:hypothetical protein
VRRARVEGTTEGAGSSGRRASRRDSTEFGQRCAACEERRVACGVRRAGCGVRRAGSRADGQQAGRQRSLAGRRPTINSIWKYRQTGPYCRKSSKSKPLYKLWFGQNICPKALALDKKFVHVQRLDMAKALLENVLSFPNLKFTLDKENQHRWRCSYRML